MNTIKLSKYCAAVVFTAHLLSTYPATSHTPVSTTDTSDNISFFLEAVEMLIPGILIPIIQLFIPDSTLKRAPVLLIAQTFLLYVSWSFWNLWIIHSINLTGALAVIIWLATMVVPLHVGIYSNLLSVFLFLILCFCSGIPLAHLSLPLLNTLFMLLASSFVTGIIIATSQDLTEKLRSQRTRRIQGWWIFKQIIEDNDWTEDQIIFFVFIIAFAGAIVGYLFKVSFIEELYRIP